VDWIDDLSVAWRREYPDLDTSALPPLVRIARLAILIEGFQREVLEPFELTASDYSVLAALRRAGEPYRLSPSLLYSRLERSSGGMTKMLKRLEERGLIRRAPDPEDGRGSLVSLTRSGVRIQEQIFNAFLAASDDLLTDLGARGRRALDDTLRPVLERFEGDLQA
jgi:DNA-binding MarR family transcriptional regulator